MTAAHFERRFSTRLCPYRLRRRVVGSFCPVSQSRQRNAFRRVWEDLAEAFDRLGEVDIDVIIDCGRIGPSGPPGRPAGAQRIDCRVATSTLRSIMSARVHLPTLRDHPRLISRTPSTGLIVVGEGSRTTEARSPEPWRCR